MWIAVIATLCIISSFGTIVFANLESSDTHIQSTTSVLPFSPLEIEQDSVEYLSIEMQDVSTYLMSPGKPVLPKVVEIIELPFGARDVKVEVTMEGISEKQILAEVRPSQHLLRLSSSNQMVSTSPGKDVEVYNSDNPYPSNWYSYTLRSGLNKDNNRVIFAIVHLYPVRYIPNLDKILHAESSDITVTYELPSDALTASEDPYDLVIIAPSEFEPHLERLVTHKNNVGVRTFLKTTEDIYAEYDGVDPPEQIKYFIKNALDTHDITYVLLVGGLKSQIYAKPRDDANYGSSGWYVPVRYANLYDKPKFPLDNPYEDIFDPGAISDLYYADIYDGEGNFSCWDPNDDGIFAAWGIEGVENDYDIDYVPDVYVGRLACRSVAELNTVVDKIITYETTSVKDSDWFNRVTVVAGDGFLDQQDINIEWDINELPDGHYTIHAQSFNKEGEESFVDIVPIRIDRSQETSLTFKHNDHLNPALANGYPTIPIAEIVTVSPGDVLGNTDFTYTPPDTEAYCNYFLPWANMSYVDGVLTIRGKSYDPKPYGYLTDMHVWITDEAENEVFSEWRYDLEMYYEGEWVTGEKVVKGRGGALYYMDGFEGEKIWPSSGALTGMNDVLQALNKGSGFLFFSGHGSANVWGDHFPGVPGNRQHGSFTGLSVINIRPWWPFISFPIMPIDTLSNAEKLPVAIIGGCHNSQFNVSMLPAMYDILPNYFPRLPKVTMWTYGTPVPQCFSWRLVRNPNGGSIASIGNTGFGYGMPGKDLTTGGGDGWITIEFFRQYGEHGQTVLGNAHSQAITTYIQTHDMSDFEAGHAKTVQQWALLGDPSLQIGGY